LIKTYREREREEEREGGREGGGHVKVSGVGESTFASFSRLVLIVKPGSGVIEIPFTLGMLRIDPR
jgi:hypothetical protein